MTGSLASQIPEAARVRLGRVIRRIVDDTLRDGDGSGELTAREAFDALADKLDPDHREAGRDAELLLAGAREVHAALVSDECGRRPAGSGSS